MSPNIAQYDYVHLAVDFQITSLRYLRADHWKEFVEKETAFVAQLRDLLVPTVWLTVDSADFRREFLMRGGAGKVDIKQLAKEVMQRPNKIAVIPMIDAWPDDQPQPRDREQLLRHELVEANVKKDEIIHIRSRGDNPFNNETDRERSQSALVKIVKQAYQAKRLIITGLNSSENVAGTIFGALIEGDESVVVTDLLADRIEQIGRLPLEWHAHAIRMRVAQLIGESRLSSPHQEQLFQAAINKIHFTTAKEIIGVLEKQPRPSCVPVLYQNTGPT